MADVDPFDMALAGLKRVMVDLDGDGRPDAVTTVDVRGEMGRLDAIDRPTGLPDYLRQGIRDVQTQQGAFDLPDSARGVHPLLGGIGEAAQFGAEMTGIPGMVRGAGNIRQGVSDGSAARTAFGAGQAALGAMPMASAVRPVANALFASAPRTVATVGGPMAAMLPFQASEARAASTDKANAAVAKSPDVQRLRDELRQLNQRRIDIQTQGIPGQKAASADASRARMDAALGEQIKAVEAALGQTETRERESYTQNAPFREKYPEAVPAIMAAGGTMAFGLPFGNALKGRMADAFRANRLGSEADDIVRQAGMTGPNAAPVADLAVRQGRLEQSAKAFNDRTQGAIPATINGLGAAGGIGLSGFALAEASAVPEQLDFMLNPPGHPARETASNLFRDPNYYKDRLAPFFGGAGLGVTGKKLASTITPGGGLDQARIDAAANIGTPEMVDRMNRITQHRQWVQNPPALANGAGGGALPPGGPGAGGAAPQRGLPPPPVPGQNPGPVGATYEQAGAHGQIARQYLDELLTANERSRIPLTSNPNITEIVARNLEARYAAAGVPMPNPEALRQRAQQTVDELTQVDRMLRSTGQGHTSTAPSRREGILKTIQGNPGMLSVPFASGAGGAALNALGPRPEDSAY